MIKDLRECLTLYLNLQTRMFWMELTTLLSPKLSVLRLCIKHHSIQVKERNFQLFHRYST